MGFVSGNVSAVLSLKASTLIVAGTRLHAHQTLNIQLVEERAKYLFWLLGDYVMFT